MTDHPVHKPLVVQTYSGILSLYDQVKQVFVSRCKIFFGEAQSRSREKNFLDIGPDEIVIWLIRKGRGDLKQIAPR
jgi:hypothetical protein